MGAKRRANDYRVYVLGGRRRGEQILPNSAAGSASRRNSPFRHVLQVRVRVTLVVESQTKIIGRSGD